MAPRSFFIAKLEALLFVAYLSPILSPVPLIAVFNGEKPIVCHVNRERKAKLR